jgi:type IV fimbrial biogenesis protein FimT
MATSRVTGFSLIELMVALSVMALLMMAVSPSVTAWVVNLRIRNAAEALQTGLQTARNEAVRRNQKMTFWLISSPNPAVLGTDCTVSATGGSWVVSVSTPASACNSAPSTTTSPMLVASHALGDGASSAVSVAGYLTDGTTAASSAAFDGFGRISSTSTSPIGVIQVSSATNAGVYRSLRLLVSSAGAVRMCDPAVTAAGDPRKC